MVKQNYRVVLLSDTTTIPPAYICHYGVKGMRWGIINEDDKKNLRSRVTNAPNSSKYVPPYNVQSKPGNAHVTLPANAGNVHTIKPAQVGPQLGSNSSSFWNQFAPSNTSTNERHTTPPATIGPQPNTKSDAANDAQQIAYLLRMFKITDTNSIDDKMMEMILNFINEKTLNSNGTLNAFEILKYRNEFFSELKKLGYDIMSLVSRSKDESQRSSSGRRPYIPVSPSRVGRA